MIGRIKLQIMSAEIDYKQAGYNTFTKDRNSEVVFEELFPGVPARNHSSPSKPFENFWRGWLEAENEWKAQQRKLAGEEEFLKEYNALCNKYKVKINTGCGCCDGGAWINGFSFNVDTDYE